MKKNLFFLILLFLSGHALAQQFTSTSLFTANNNKSNVTKIAHKGTSLSLSGDELDRIFLNKPSTFDLQIPFEGKTLILELEEYKPLSKAFQVSISAPGGKSEWYPFQEGLFFKGKIKSERKSFVALSFFKGEVMGVIADENSNISIASVKNNGFPTNDYVMYRNIDATFQPAVKCLVEGADNIPTQGQGTVSISNSAAIGCPIDIYVEADNSTYLSNGSNITNTVNFVATIMNGVSIVYLKENISMQLREVKVWTTNDPYSANPDARDILKVFKGNMSAGYNGDLATLFSTRNLGTSVGAVNVLCNPDPGARAAVVTTLNAANPASDINTYLVAHELGHNLGSLHTQSCSWVGGALDNCAPPEGTCAPGPAPTNGGTIMSYCSVNLANGFGQQPGDKIRADVANAPCLCTCNNMEVTVSEANTTCGSNATALFTGVTGPVNFLWDDGESTATAIRLTSGWHYVTVTSQSTPACKIITGVKVNSASVFPPPDTIIASGNTSFCQGDSVILSVTPQNGNQYKWYKDNQAIPGAVQSSLAIKVSGNYFVNITNGPCAINSKSKTIVVNALPPKPSISRVDSLLVSSSQAGNQWFLNGAPIPGANGNSLKGPIDGNYTLRLTVNGCTSGFSNPFYFQLVSITLNDEVKVYPNPTDKNVTISNNKNRNLLIRLVNVAGQELFTQATSNATISINVSNYPSASYILSITDRDKHERIKKVLVKN